MPDKRITDGHVRPLAPIPTGMEPSGKLIGRVCCVLFDIYGTLVISASGDIGISAKQDLTAGRLAGLLDKYDLRADPGCLQDNLRAAVLADHEKNKKKGVDFPEVRIEEIWMKVLDISDPDRVKNFAIEYEWLVNPVYPMPGLVEMLGALKRMNIPMGIISNAQFYTPLLFERLLGSGMEHLGFEKDLIFFSCDLGCAKPSQTIFKHAVKSLERRETAPGATLYMGNDMLNDIWPAARAGMQTALFAGDARSMRLRTDHPECRNFSADLVVTGLMQVPELIRSAGRNGEKHTT